MKKITISTDKLKEFVETRKKLIIITVSVVLVVATVGCAYLSLNPPENSEAAEEGQEAVRALEIRFDTNMINQLGEQTAPAVIDGQGGRNPFASY